MYPIGSMYGIYVNIGGILMVNDTIYRIHGSYGHVIAINVNIGWYYSDFNFITPNRGLYKNGMLWLLQSQYPSRILQTPQFISSGRPIWTVMRLYFILFGW